MDIKEMDLVSSDDERRFKGLFFTPKLFADYAHSRIDKHLGSDWRDKYVVWDNCCGTKNLTKDYKFNRLYCSTLMDAELEASKEFSKEAVSFQFDFLNDDLTKLPERLLEDLRANKPIIFLLNPPYASAGTNRTDESSKKGVAKTKINERMIADKIGACSQNLYAQFLYRIELIKREFNLTNVNICLFSPTLFLSGSSYKKFRSVFLKSFKFENAFQFKASYFADCSDKWAISFSIWTSGETADKNNFDYDCVDLVKGSMKNIDNTVVYNLDNSVPASDWVKERYGRDIDVLSQKSGVKIGSKTFKVDNDYLACLTNGCNNVYANSEDVYMMSSPNDRGKTNIQVLPTNFTRCTSLFSARSLVKGNWINDKDEYIKPNIDFAEQENNELKVVDKTVVYNLDGSTSANDWAKTTEDNDAVFPNLSSGVNIKTTSTKWNNSAIGYVFNKGNNIGLNAKNVAFFSAPFGDAHGFSVMPENFTKATSLFSARSLVKGNWVNDKDEYIKPNIDFAEQENNELQVVEKTIVYNLDGLTPANEWAKASAKNDAVAPNLSTGVNVKEKDTKWAQNSIGYIYTDGSNSVDKNAQGVACFTSPFSNAHGFSVIQENSTKATALFSARSLVEKNWTNSTNEYIKPQTGCSLWKEFENDSVVYSLFSSKSNQSSLRQVDYKGKKWDIKNEFFWMAKNEIMYYANKYSLDDIVKDAEASEERYVYKYLQTITLSPEASKVYVLACNCVIDSFQYRASFAEHHPEYQIDKAWDCGWYQIKAVLKEYMPERLKEFQKAYKELSNKMLPMVYQVGFLKNGKGRV